MTHNFENELVNISEINRGLIPTNPFTPNPNAYPPSSSSVLKGGFPFEKSSDISTVNSESQTMNYDRSCKVSKFTDSEMSLNKSGSSNLVNSFNVSNLPRYGIKEQSTQTMLTARDIECLEYVNKEFLERKEEFMKTFLITHKEILRKMFEDEKMTYANTEDQKNSEKFLQKLRNSSSPIKYLNKKKINKKDKTSLDDEYPKIKKIKIHKGRKPKDRENFDLGLNGDYLVNDMSTSDLVLGKEQLVSNLFDIKEPLNVQKKIKSLNEEFNIKDMINDIKNGGNKDVYVIN